MVSDVSVDVVKDALMVAGARLVEVLARYSDLSVDSCEFREALRGVAEGFVEGLREHGVSPIEISVKSSGNDLLIGAWKVGDVRLELYLLWWGDCGTVAKCREEHGVELGVDVDLGDDGYTLVFNGVWVTYGRW